MRTLLLLLPAALLAATLQAQTAPAPKVAKAAASTKSATPAKPAAAAVTNYKESGNPNATVVIEAYTDYECPHCARFYKEFKPQFTADYIASGKVKFVHRDLPLTQIHTHAQLAARFADAAGQVGYYDVAVSQLFKTQDEWSMYGKNTGNIDAELTAVIPPGAMQKIRELVKTDAHLDETIQKDVAMATNVDRIPSTPGIVVIAKGKRDVISNILDLPYGTFKKYLDSKIGQ